ncbi:MAG: hypothetical protein P8Z37_03370 [Acidobacteriota bacterium]
MFQFVLTPAAGKRLIAKAVAAHPDIQPVLKSGIIAVVAGTTNGYVAEELLAALNQGEGFDRKRFFRGVTLPPSSQSTGGIPLPGTDSFPGDVIIVDGAWQKGKTIFDALDSLKEGDVVLKGANAVDITRRHAGVLIGDPKCGTVVAALQAAIGRRTRLILPVGVEKRIPGALNSIAQVLNAPGAKGPRIFPVPGEILTELDAIRILTGAEAEITAAGGVGGAEGAVWLTITGESSQEKAAHDLMDSVCREPLFSM